MYEYRIYIILSTLKYNKYINNYLNYLQVHDISAQQRPSARSARRVGEFTSLQSVKNIYICMKDLRSNNAWLCYVYDN